MTAGAPPGADRIERINAAIVARPATTAALLVALLAALLAVVALVLEDASPETDVLSWVVVALFVFDGFIVWLFPAMVGVAAARVAIPVAIFAAAPALTAYSTVFLGQPRWLFATGFAVSVALVVISTHRLRSAGGSESSTEPG